MSDLEHTHYQQWLDLEADGELSGVQQSQLLTHLAGCEECRQDRQSLRRFHQLLDASRIDVHPQLRERVLQSLAAAPWQSPAAHPKSVVAGLLVAMATLIAAASLLVAQGAPASESSSLLSLIGAVTDFVTTSALAGAGLLAVSWRGVGMAVETWLLASLPNLILSTATVVGLNLLLFRLLRQSGRLAPTAARRRTGSRRLP